MTIDAQSLREDGVSVRRFSQDICHYLQVEWTEQYYLRINRVMKGEVSPTDEEVIAFDKWRQVHSAPHQYGAKCFRIMEFERALRKLQQQVAVGIYNPQMARKTLKRIIDVVVG